MRQSGRLAWDKALLSKHEGLGIVQMEEVFLAVFFEDFWCLKNRTCPDQNRRHGEHSDAHFFKESCRLKLQFDPMEARC